MKHYALQPDEVVLYQNDLALKDQPRKSKLTFVLTNLYFVFITTTKKIIKEEVQVDAFAVETVKIYQDKPWIIQKNNEVELYFKGAEKSLIFPSKGEAHKFVLTSMKLLTGKSAFFRGVDKTKKTIAEVDEALGIDTVSTATAIATKGASLWFKNKKGTETTKEVFKFTDGILRRKESKQIAPPADEQLEAVKKLKLLLDENVITQEEFETKKKEILNL